MRSNGVLLFGAGLVAGSIVGWFIKFPPVDSSSAAGWVQAIGSIAAIGGAFVVATQQARVQQLHARELEDGALHRRWLSVKAILDSIYQQCLDVEAEFSGDDDFKFLNFVGNYDKKSLLDGIERLNSIPLFDLNSDILVTAVIGLKDEATIFLNWIEEGCARRFGEETELDASDYAVKDVARGVLKRIRKHYGDAVSVTGGAYVTVARPRFYRHIEN